MDVTQLQLRRNHSRFIVRVNTPYYLFRSHRPPEATKIVYKANLCFNCLGNHKVSQCNSKYQCKHCRHKHHTSLCKPNDSDTPRSSTQGTDTQVQQLTQQATQQVGAHTAPVLHGVHSNKETLMTVTLLKTAIAPVVGEGVGNILFDEGSQRHLLLRRLQSNCN